MKRLYVVIALVFVFEVSASSAGWTNPQTGIMELLFGEISLNDVFSSPGIIIGPSCMLKVDGDVNAGSVFICRGGDIQITGKLTADVIYFDSAEAELDAEIGEVSAKFYTQCGGTVKISGNIVARSCGEDDGRGIINVNNEFSTHNTTMLTVGGGVFARGGDIRAGALPDGDEVSMASFFVVRGITITGYDYPASCGGDTYIYAGKGLNATDGGTVYMDYLQ